MEANFLLNVADFPFRSMYTRRCLTHFKVMTHLATTIFLQEWYSKNNFAKFIFVANTLILVLRLLFIQMASVCQSGKCFTNACESPTVALY